MTVGELKKYLDDIDDSCPVLFEDSRSGSIDVGHIYLCETPDAYLLFTNIEEDVAEDDEEILV